MKSDWYKDGDGQEFSGFVDGAEIVGDRYGDEKAGDKPELIFG